ncbi:MAG: PfkB family carbohydrate kinase [Planctomycetota bacterium]
MDPLQVIGLGVATVDVLQRMRDLPHWSQTENTVLHAFELDGGGMAATAMVAAARLGCRAGFIGTAGSDAMGRFKREGLEREGVDTRGLVVRPGPDGQVVLVFVHAETGERVFAPLREFADHPVTPAELDRDHVSRTRYLLIDGYHTDAALQAAACVHAAGGEVVLDASPYQTTIMHRMGAIIAVTDILIGSEHFARRFTGNTDRTGACRALLDLGPRVVVQTEGRRGSLTVTRTELFETAAFPVQVVDTTGAGDVFHGAYVSGLLQGLDLRETARFAGAVSALKCTALGGRRGIPGLEQTRAFLAQHV